MRFAVVSLVILGAQTSFAATKADCLSGKFPACLEVVSNYGKTTDKSGATDFFAKACASQNLNISCEIVSTEKSETLKKTLDHAGPDSGMFVVSGTKIDKIYRISPTVKVVPHGQQ